MRVFIKCLIASVVFGWTGLVRTKSILMNCLFRPKGVHADDIQNPKLRTLKLQANGPRNLEGAEKIRTDVQFKKGV